jgi:hypothetical protein
MMDRVTGHFASLNAGDGHTGVFSQIDEEHKLTPKEKTSRVAGWNIAGI